MFVSVYLAKFF